MVARKEPPCLQATGRAGILGAIDLCFPTGGSQRRVDVAVEHSPISESSDDGSRVPLRELAEKARRFPPELSEKDTETTLVEPFIEALGFDTRDPEEVRTQFEIAIGSMTVKCDYVILQHGEPVILIECKKVSARLDNPGQLSSYFGQMPSALLGIYTIGLEYRFYADQIHGRVKRMDEDPFLEFDIHNFYPTSVALISRCSKDNMEDSGGFILWLNDLRFERTLERRLHHELTESPSDKLVFLAMGWAGIEEPTQEQTEQFRTVVTAVGRRLFRDRLADTRASAPSARARRAPVRSSSPLSSGEWMPLDSEFPTTGNPPPSRIRLPDGERDISSWRDVPKEVALWLHDRSMLNRDNCEFTVTGTRYLLSSSGQHSTGRAFHSLVPIGNTGIQMEGSFNPDKLVSHTCELLQRFGQARSSVYLRLA